MTEEFKIAPNHDTMLYLLQFYGNTSPPRYKSSQRAIKAMREEWKIEPYTEHYAAVLSTISTRWSNFNPIYKELENVNDAYLKQFKHGIDLTRNYKVFNTEDIRYLNQ